LVKKGQYDLDAFEGIIAHLMSKRWGPWTILASLRSFEKETYGTNPHSGAFNNEHRSAPRVPSAAADFSFQLSLASFRVTSTSMPRLQRPVDHLPRACTCAHNPSLLIKAREHLDGSPNHVPCPGSFCPSSALPCGLQRRPSAISVLHDGSRSHHL
jgi:hypothetical protein